MANTSIVGSLDPPDYEQLCAPVLYRPRFIDHYPYHVIKDATTGNIRAYLIFYGNSTFCRRPASAAGPEPAFRPVSKALRGHMAAWLFLHVGGPFLRCPYSKIPIHFVGSILGPLIFRNSHMSFGQYLAKSMQGLAGPIIVPLSNPTSTLNVALLSIALAVSQISKSSPPSPQGPYTHSFGTLVPKPRPFRASEARSM